MRSSRIMTVVGIQIVCVDTELERWRRLPLGLQLHALGYGLGCVPHGGRIVGRQCYQCVHLKIRIFLPKCGYIKQDSILKKLAFETDLISINELWSKRSEEHTSELQSLMRISYAVYCLQKK